MMGAVLFTVMICFLASFAAYTWARNMWIREICEADRREKNLRQELDVIMLASGCRLLRNGQNFYYLRFVDGSMSEAYYGFQVRAGKLLGIIADGQTEEVVVHHPHNEPTIVTS